MARAPSYLPKVGQVYRWLTYEYGFLVLSGLVLLSTLAFRYDPPRLFAVSIYSFFVLSITASVVVIALSVFGIKNPDNSQRYLFLRCLLFSLVFPLGIVVVSSLGIAILS